jgi:ribosome modulation factor
MLRLNPIVPARLVAMTALLAWVDVSQAEMPHHRPCDIAQDKPGNLNPGGGSAIMFGLCSGIDDLGLGEEPSRDHFWNAFNCGYQAYRQGKVFGANPYYHDELETRWSEGWKAAQKACKTGKRPF